MAPKLKPLKMIKILSNGTPVPYIVKPRPFVKGAAQGYYGPRL